MDPCVRKTTKPSQVFAPPKRQWTEVSTETTVGDVIENLILFNSESQGKVGINNNGDTIEAENEHKNSFHPTLEIGLRKRDLIIEPPSKKQKTNHILEDDLVLSEEDDMKSQSSQTWKLLPLSSPNFKTVKKPDEKVTKKQGFKSKEFLSDSEEEKPRNDAPKTLTKLIEALPMAGQKPCKYIFKNQPKKGLRCGQLSKEDHCQAHKKLLAGNSVVHGKESVESLKKQIYDLKKSFEEKDSKSLCKISNLEKEMYELKQCLNGFKSDTKFEIKNMFEEQKNQEQVAGSKKEAESFKKCVRDLQINMQEISNKIEHISTHETYKSDQKLKLINQTKLSSTIRNTKINKLNREMVYKLTKYIGEEGVFESLSGTFRMKIPSKMNKPSPEEKPTLKFNPISATFEWTEV